jgi:hypothetical protein
MSSITFNVPCWVIAQANSINIKPKQGQSVIGYSPKFLWIDAKLAEQGIDEVCLPIYTDQNRAKKVAEAQHPGLVLLQVVSLFDLLEILEKQPTIVTHVAFDPMGTGTIEESKKFPIAGAINGVKSALTAPRK